jgi:hypothetical protein
MKEDGMANHGVGYFEVCPEHLGAVLGLSSEDKIIGVEWYFPSGGVKIYVESKAVGEIPIGGAIPRLTPVWSKGRMVSWFGLLPEDEK